MDSLKKTKEAIRIVQSAANDEVEDLKSKVSKEVEAHEM